jgi:hypothetical protein
MGEGCNLQYSLQQHIENSSENEQEVGERGSEFRDSGIGDGTCLLRTKEQRKPICEDEEISSSSFAPDTASQANIEPSLSAKGAPVSANLDCSLKQRKNSISTRNDFLENMENKDGTTYPSWVDSKNFQRLRKRQKQRSKKKRNRLQKEIKRKIENEHLKEVSYSHSSSCSFSCNNLLVSNNKETHAKRFGIKGKR